MRSTIPDPPKTRIYSPDKKLYVDAVDCGEIAMGAVKQEIITPFDVDGTKSFTVVNGGAFFMDDNSIVIYEEHDNVLVYFAQEKKAYHLSKENLEPPGLILLELEDPSNPVLVIHRSNGSEEKYPLKEALHLFEPGRGFIF